MADQRRSVGYLVKAAQAALHARMEEALRPLGISVSHYACLHLLSENPGISAAQLARDAFVTRQSMNALLQALVERGLARRPERAAAGRALPAELTEAGMTVLGRAEELVGEIEARMLSGLDADRRSELGRSLAACIDALGTAPAT